MIGNDDDDRADSHDECEDLADETEAEVESRLFLVPRGRGSTRPERVGLPTTGPGLGRSWRLSRPPTRYR